MKKRKDGEEGEGDQLGKEGRQINSCEGGRYINLIDK